jgi:diguanylate cyclase (GGDEF)-like protein
LATALISEPISALAGVVTLLADGKIKPEQISETWFGWWFSNVLGQWFMVPSALILLGKSWRESAQFKSWVQLIATICTVAVLGSFVCGFWGTSLFNPQMVYLILPFMIFISVRLGQLASSLSTLMMMVLLNVATLKHFGPFTGDDMNTRLIDLNFFLAALALSTLFVNVVFAERQGLIDALEHQTGELAQAATTDSLTKVLNRRGFYALVDNRSQPQAGSVVMVDIDYFKRLNDIHGHAKGDEVLQQVADTLKNSLRAGDILARFGGEEFIIVLPKATLEQAQATAERLRVAVEQSCQVTISMGVTQIQPSENLEATINRADELMYRSKHEGRNRVSSS